MSGIRADTSANAEEAHPAAVKRVRRSSEPSCGACGYPVKGLTSLNCPECGADFRQVGIRTGWSFGILARWIPAILWTGALLLVGVAVGGAIESSSPRTWRESYSATPTRGIPSKAYQSITVSTEAERRDWDQTRPRTAIADKTLVVTLSHLSQPPSEMRVELPDWTCRVTRSNGAAPTTSSVKFTEEAVLEWFRSEGLDVPNPSVAQEAGALARLIYGIESVNASKFQYAPALGSTAGVSEDRVNGAAPFDAITFRYAYGLHRDHRLPYLATAPVFVVWAIGLIWIVRRQMHASAASSATRATG